MEPLPDSGSIPDASIPAAVGDRETVSAWPPLAKAWNGKIVVVPGDELLIFFRRCPARRFPGEV